MFMLPFVGKGLSFCLFLVQGFLLNICERLIKLEFNCEYELARICNPLNVNNKESRWVERMLHFFATNFVAFLGISFKSLETKNLVFSLLTAHLFFC